MPSNFDKSAIRGRCVERRVELNFSQAEVAHRAECKQQSVAEIEKCGSYSLGLLEKVAKALDVHLEWLRTGRGPRELSNTAPSMVREEPVGYDAAREEIARQLAEGPEGVARRLGDAELCDAIVEWAGMGLAAKQFFKDASFQNIIAFANELKSRIKKQREERRR